jgi:hypothetical protein
MSRVLYWLLLAALACAPLGLSARSLEAKPAEIDRNGVLILIRSTLLALDQANKTGNYTVLRDLGAPDFQTNSAARLGDIFAKLRESNLDLSGVAVLDPQLTVLPEIEANGLMRMVGFFPSVPNQINFELVYAPVNRQWRLYTIAVGLAQSGPVAPAPPPSKPLKGKSSKAAAPTIAAKHGPPPLNPNEKQ